MLFYVVELPKIAFNTYITKLRHVLEYVIAFTDFTDFGLWLRLQVDAAEREASGSDDPRPRTRAAAPRMAAWAAVDAATTREETLASLEDLREDGEASLWNSFRLAPRPVSLGELCRGAAARKARCAARSGGGK